MITLHVNGKPVDVDVAPDTPLLWVLREQLQSTGTKFGCGASLCGACTVHLDGRPIRSCVTPVAQVGTGRIITIEGLSATGDETSPTDVADARRRSVTAAVQHAWVQRTVAQCGYCQSGMVMAAVALLIDNASPTDAEIDAAFAGHICRCGTYQRLRAAVHDAAKALALR
jgi:isoquinoline 1-oxidoreductase alpha subunit